MSELSSHSMTDSNDTECPTCGRDDFKNAHGMKIHHANEHGLSIAKEMMACEYCGVEEERYPSQVNDLVFCSTPCESNWKDENYHGENNPNWGKPGVVGSDNHFWEGGKTKEIVCEQCGDTKEVKQSEVGRFCSQNCLHQWQSENWVGENHHLYNPDATREFGPNWDEQAEKARERDNYQCQSCGKHQDDHYRRLIGHHIIPRKHFFDENGEYDHERGDRLENIVSVCDSCHPTWEGLYLKPQLLPTE